MKFFYIFLIFFTYATATPIDISKMNDGIDIVKNIQYYRDVNSKSSFAEILNTNISYKTTQKSTISFGYNHTDTVWLKFELLNSSKDSVSKVLEFDNIHIGEFELYNLNTNKSILSGYNHQKADKSTTTYPISIELNAGEAKKFIMRTTSAVTPLNIKLRIWDARVYENHQLRHQIALALFFGAIAALLIYNLFLFSFTKDITYFYYCGYLFGMILHTLYFTGFLNLYIVPGFYLEDRYVADIFIYMLIIFIAPFVRNYLRLEKIAPKIDKILVLIPIVVTFIAICKITGLISTQISILLYLLNAPLMIFIGAYALYLGVREAYYFLAGWTFMICGMLLMALYTTGVLPIFVEFPYLLELGYFGEAIIFSIGLAARINLSKELEKALAEKDILFKELHHRVKNNLQMVVSLLRMQNDRIEDENLQEVLISAQNRINAMSNLHKLLYQQESITHIDTRRYFEQIIDEIKRNFPDKNSVQIALNITTDLSIDQAVYCGLIVNELISNAVKYAFIESNGKITVSLYKKNQDTVLEVTDDGVGFVEDEESNSLGLLLVKTLVTRQLKGKYSLFVNNGTHVIISFKRV